MAITIRDVAKQLNLSITQVSRALDGYGDVSEETRQRVIETAQRMGYVPNRAARQLRRQRSDTVGFILPTSTPRFNEPFYSEFIAGLADEASLHSLDLLVSIAPPDKSEEELVYKRWVQSRKVDGIILNRIRLMDWRVQYLARQRVPFVSLERSLDPVEYASIEVDSRAGVRQLVAYLASLGHRRIGYVGGPGDMKIQVDRYAGYMDGLNKAGIPIEPDLETEGDLTSQGGYQAALQLLSLPQPPTAITCVNDLTAIGVLHAAHDRKMTIGHDLSVAGFDGIGESAHTEPPLTTLYQPVYEIARRLVMMLNILVCGEELDEKHIRYQPELVIRESTGAK
ncbi:MAG: LacI family DNA-binding transcriptional regulator [Omnitrophica WOR_2 bacterium]